MGEETATQYSADQHRGSTASFPAGLELSPDDIPIAIGSSSGSNTTAPMVSRVFLDPSLNRSLRPWRYSGSEFVNRIGEFPATAISRIRILRRPGRLPETPRTTLVTIPETGVPAGSRRTPPIDTSSAIAKLTGVPRTAVFDETRSRETNFIFVSSGMLTLAPCCAASSGERQMQRADGRNLWITGSP